MSLDGPDSVLRGRILPVVNNLYIFFHTRRGAGSLRRFEEISFLRATFRARNRNYFLLQVFSHVHLHAYSFFSITNQIDPTREKVVHASAK